MENKNTPRWVKDVQGYIDSIPFGDVSVKVKRVNRKTTEIHTVAEETLRYVDNQEAIRDLDRLVTSLIETKFSGDAHLKIQMKDGAINVVSVFNTKQTRY